MCKPDNEGGISTSCLKLTLLKMVRQTAAFAARLLKGALFISGLYVLTG